MLQFVGDIPSEIGKLTNLKLLDLACTPFQTPLPTELARLSGLDVVLACLCEDWIMDYVRWCMPYLLSPNLNKGKVTKYNFM